MKRIVTYFVLFCTPVFFLFSSCKEGKYIDTPGGGETEEVEFKLLSPSEMTFDAEGGAGVIQYELNNPAGDGTIDISPKDGWAGSFDTSKEGEISFSVEENTAKEERTCILKISYIYDGNSSKFFDVVIKQSAAEDVPQEAAFVITVDKDKVTYSTADCNVSPKDPEMTYITMVVKKSIVEKFEGDDKAWFDDDIRIFESDAGMFGMSLKDYLENYKMQKGNLDYRASGLTPSTEYWCYAYGIEFDESGNPVMLTPIVKEEFTTSTPSSNPDDFIIQVSAVGETGVELLIIPYSDEVLYYYDNIPSEYLDKYSGTAEERLAQYGYDYIHPFLGMWTVENFGWYGSQAKNFWNIKPDKTYFAYAYILNDDGSAKDGKVWYKEYTMASLSSADKMSVGHLRPESR